MTSYEKALWLYRAIGYRRGDADTLRSQSLLLIDDDPQRAQGMIEQALALHQVISAIDAAGFDMYAYGFELMERGHHLEALEYLDRARQLFLSCGLQINVQDTDDLIARLQRVITKSDEESQ
jgi:hypothetical protein